jgi:hypothetical protein
MQCRLCHGPLTEMGGLGNATHYRCRDCGADQSRMTARTDVTKPSKTRWQVALEVQDVTNPTAVCDELAEQIGAFSRSPDYSGSTESICRDPSLRLIVAKLADLFGVADLDAWADLAKSLH